MFHISRFSKFCQTLCNFFFAPGKILPLKPNPMGFLLHFLCFHQSRQRRRKLAHNTFRFRLSRFLLFLNFLPVSQHCFRILRLHIGKNMRMTTNHLFCDGIHHIMEIERTFPFRQRCMKNHLQQHIAQFFLQMHHIITVNGLYHFIGFFQQILAQGLMSLLLIPGAAIFTQQHLHHICQRFYRITHSYSLTNFSFNNNTANLFPTFGTFRIISRLTPPMARRVTK